MVTVHALPFAVLVRKTLVRKEAEPDPAQLGKSVSAVGASLTALMIICIESESERSPPKPVPPRSEVSNVSVSLPL